MREVLIATLVIIASCGDEPGGGSGPGGNSEVESYNIPEKPLPALDLLIVIDDTTAFASYRANLANLPAAVEASLRDPDGAMPDLRIAVTTTTASGTLRTAAAIQDAYLVDEVNYDGTRTTNYQGTLPTALAALLDTGATSTSANQPLHAMQRALADSGWVRPDAFLTALAITATDDASADTVAFFATVVKASKLDPGRIAVAGVYPSPAPRLDAFFAEFPARAFVADLATIDYASSSAIVPYVSYSLPGYPCYALPADLDPDAPGRQQDCAFVMEIDGVESTLRECGTGAMPCIEFVEGGCPADTAELVTRGFPGASHPAIRGQCVVD